MSDLHSFGVPTPRAMAYQLGDEGVNLTVRATGSIAAAERAVRAIRPQFFPNSCLNCGRLGTSIPPITLLMPDLPSYWAHRPSSR